MQLKRKVDVENRNYLNCTSCNDNSAINISRSINTNVNWAKWNFN